MNSGTKEFLLGASFFVGLAVLVAWGITSIQPKKYKDHIYQPGDCVEIVISGEQGMVRDLGTYRPRYAVRVALASHTNTAIFGAPNTENQRYASVWFDEFELESCK